MIERLLPLLSNKRFLLLAGLIIFIVLPLLFLSLLQDRIPRTEISPFPLPTIVQAPEGSFPESIPSPVIVPNDNYSADDASISFEIENPNLPKSANVYRLSGYGITEEYANSIAQSFSFRTPPTRETDVSDNTILTWTDANSIETLFIVLNAGYIQYLSRYTPVKAEIGAPTVKTITSGEEAITIAKRFLESKKLYFPNIFTLNNTVLYYAGDPEKDPQRVNTFEEASFLQITFSQTLDGKIVYVQFATPSQTTVTIDKFGTIRNMKFQSPIIKDYQPFTLKTFDEAREALLNNEGTVAQFGSTLYGAIEEQTIRSIVLQSVEVSYLDDKESGFIQPIFLFKGYGVSSEGLREDIIMYLPATQ